jgi:hypothetical protein
LGYPSILSAAPFKLKLVDFGGIMLTELVGPVGLVGIVGLVGPALAELAELVELVEGSAELAELVELVEIVEGPVEPAELDLVDSSAKTYGYHLNGDSFLPVLFC